MCTAVLRDLAGRATWASPQGEDVTPQEASESIPKTMTDRNNFGKAVDQKHGTEKDPRRGATAYSQLK